MNSRVWGIHPVLEALRAGNVVEIMAVPDQNPGRGLSDIRRRAGALGVPILERNRAELQAVADGANAQGVVAIVRTTACDLDDLLLPTTEHDHDPGFLLALDQVQDPHNLGALLRTADAAGVRGAIVPERRSAPLAGVVAKTSAGASAYVLVAVVPNLARALDRCRETGNWIVGLDSAGESSLYDVDLTAPLVLVIGGEEKGLRRLTRERCDVVASVPMRGHVASLNASVAGAIAMYEVLRQRQIAKF